MLTSFLSLNCVALLIMSQNTHLWLNKWPSDRCTQAACKGNILTSDFLMKRKNTSVYLLNSIFSLTKQRWAWMQLPCLGTEIKPFGLVWSFYIHIWFVWNKCSFHSLRSESIPVRYAVISCGCWCLALCRCPAASAVFLSPPAVSFLKSQSLWELLLIKWPVAVLEAACPGWLCLWC